MKTITKIAAQPLVFSAQPEIVMKISAIPVVYDLVQVKPSRQQRRKLERDNKKKKNQ